MVRIKICGLRRKQDIEWVNFLKVDYAGFVFAESRRRVDLKEAERLSALLEKGIKKVGVFVNQSPDFVKGVCGALGIDVIQLHGDESQKEIESYLGLGFEVWKAIRIKDKSDLISAFEYRVDGVLLDAAVRGMYGGTGRTFNWDILKGVYFKNKIILAGGLDPQNVGLAIAKVKPFAVDVSSGVETEGYKDFFKMKEFVERVRGFGKHDG